MGINNSYYVYVIKRKSNWDIWGDLCMWNYKVLKIQEKRYENTDTNQMALDAKELPLSLIFPELIFENHN